MSQLPASASPVTSVAGKTGDVTLNKSDVGLSNVDNTSDANKPISNATQTALNLKANLASPTFTGTVGGITKSMVGLSNVDDTSDANKPVSTATQTALDAKQDKTGAPIQIASATYTLSSSDDGKILEFTSTDQTITINAGIAIGFACVVMPKGTATIAFSGTTGNGAATNITRAAASNRMFAIVERGSDNNAYEISGS